MARDVLEQDLDMAGKRVYGPRAPVEPTDIVRLQDLNTFTDGLTLDPVTRIVHGDYITGKAGGQTWTGGTAAADGLTIRTTSAATPTGTLTLSAGVVNLPTAGSATAPNITLGPAANKIGFYSTGSNVLRMTASGADMVLFGPLGIATLSAVIVLPAGTISNQALQLGGNAGIYSPSTSTAIAVSVNNAQIAYFSTLAAAIKLSPAASPAGNNTAATEFVGMDVDMSRTSTWATGALATQREVLFRAPTYAFAAASTLTTAATVAITGAPIAGSNATILNGYVLWTQSGTTRHDGPLRVNLTNDTAPSTIAVWDGRHAVFGVGATGISPGLGLSYSTSTTYAILSAAEPGVAWRGLRVQATTLDYYANGTVNTFSIQGATAVTAVVNVNALLFVQPTARTSGSPRLIHLDAPAHTTLGAPEAIDVYLNLARTVQFATGARATQRAMLITAPTYSFVGASTITEAATLYVSGAPIPGTFATIMNAYALWAAGSTRIDGSFRVNVGNDSAPGTIATWDGRYGVVSVGATSTSPGFGISYSSSSNQAILSAVEPGVAWRGIRVQATTLDYYANGTFNSFGISGVTAATAAVAVNAILTVTPTARTTGSPTLVTVTGPAHTTLTAEAIDVNINLARTVEFLNGSSITIQRAVLIQAPTYGFTSIEGSNTVTTAATLAITGAPIAGAYSYITYSYALWVQTGDVRIASLTGMLKGTGGVVGVGVAGTDYEAFLTFSSGVTRTANNVTGDYITGLASGSPHTWTASTASGGALTIRSTSHATRGNLTLTGGRVVIDANAGGGVASPALSFTGSSTEGMLATGTTLYLAAAANMYFMLNSNPVLSLNTSTALFDVGGVNITSSSPTNRGYFGITSANTTFVSNGVTGGIWSVVKITAGFTTYSMTSGTASVTTLAAVYVDDAPHPGIGLTVTNRYSIFCDDGIARFDGDYVSHVVWEVPSYNPGLSLQDSVLSIPVRVTGGAIYYIKLKEPIP